MKLTKNFSKSEFKCRCGCVMPIDVLDNIKLLAEQLQVIRDFVGQPISVNSAFRCKTHNSRIGSNDSSQHILGKAADITIKSFTPNEVANIVENMLTNEVLPSFYIGGLGIYKTFNHLDIRESKARW